MLTLTSEVSTLLRTPSSTMVISTQSILFKFISKTPMNWKSGIVYMTRKTLSFLGLQHVWTESGKYLKDDFLSARNPCPFDRHKPSILLLKHKIHCACRSIPLFCDNDFHRMLAFFLMIIIIFSI